MLLTSFFVAVSMTHQEMLCGGRYCQWTDIQKSMIIEEIGVDGGESNQSFSM